MFNRKSYAIQMNFEVPDSEKRIAEKAQERFEDLLSKMKLATEYLDKIYDPFKRIDNLDTKLIVKYRKTFYDYAEQIKFKYDSIIEKSIDCVILMNEFKTDTIIEEMVNSFMSNMNNLVKYVDGLLSIFTNLNDPDFKPQLISSIDYIRKITSQIKQLVNDRIVEHISTNILAKNWASDFSDNYQKVVEEKVPLVMKLFRERQEALREK